MSTACARTDRTPRVFACVMLVNRIPNAAPPILVHHHLYTPPPLLGDGKKPKISHERRLRPHGPYSQRNRTVGIQGVCPGGHVPCGGISDPYLSRPNICCGFRRTRAQESEGKYGTPEEESSKSETRILTRTQIRVIPETLIISYYMF